VTNAALRQRHLQNVYRLRQIYCPLETDRTHRDISASVDLLLIPKRHYFLNRITSAQINSAALLHFRPRYSEIVTEKKLIYVRLELVKLSSVEIHLAISANCFLGVHRSPTFLTQRPSSTDVQLFRSNFFAFKYTHYFLKAQLIFHTPLALHEYVRILRLYCSAKLAIYFPLKNPMIC
jgi:hypothetical protein